MLYCSAYSDFHQIIIRGALQLGIDSAAVDKSKGTALSPFR